jgi:translation initiation factor IF-2
MAKIRVYELARDLNMTNKTLIEKISSMNISVASHMSSLDEETIAAIKANAVGTKLKSVEVTRVRSTVIRRRKKTVSVEPVQLKDTDKPEVHIVDKSEEKDAAKTVEVTPDEPVLVHEQPVKKEKKPAVASEPPKKQRKKTAKGSPAKIIKLPDAPDIKIPAEEITPLEIIENRVEETSEVEPSTPTTTEKKEPTAESEEASKKKKKKKLSDKVDEPEKDIKWSKKRISFKRKEVVEGNELYSKAKRSKKWAGKGKKQTTGQKTLITTPRAIKRRVKIDESILLSDLARRMGIKANEIIAKMMGLGVMVTVNQTIDFETAAIVASEFDYELEKASFEEESLLNISDDHSTGNMVERPPVVTIMGHVDHGKTSLLDVIRKTRVTDIEAGGITQHIGAYHVITEKGQIVFLDTPGHEAFTSMRSRGASITDLVILVVAADDGVMPQTVEAINHAKAAKVPIVVAVNKIDKPNADPERVKRELSEKGLVPEDWGGDTMFVNVSAKKNQGIDDLLDMLILQSEMLELKADPERLSTGYVIEARIDPGRGPVATVLVQQGTLHVGEPVVCGIQYGKIRTMINDKGVQVQKAGPSIPVEITGLSGVPQAGDHMVALSDEKDAKQVSIHRIQKKRSLELAKASNISLDKLYEKMLEGKISNMNLIIKADVQGSIEAISESLTKLTNKEVKINVIHSATGTVTESDVSLAAVSDAIIVGFNVRPSMKVQALASDENVDMRFYNIIYSLIEDIKGSISGMMASTFKEHVLGRAEVREVFHIPKLGAIAGCYVTDGKIERGGLVRLLREGIITYEGNISSLRRFKDDAKEVQNGFECGIGIEKYNDIKTGDVIECYYMEEIKTQL